MAKSNTYNNNLKRPIIVWFDTEAYEEKNKMTRELLEETIGELVIVNDKKECERMFGREKCHIDRTILITTGRLGKELIPTIHHSPRLLSAYIFCENKVFHDEWAKTFDKVRDHVVTTLDELVSLILSDPYMN